MIIKDFNPFIGQHCETTATGSLLKQIGIELSEPMLFGLGQGLGFIFWNMKSMGFPFIGGRIKPDLLTENICNNLNLQLHISETSSVKKAWEGVTNSIKKGKAVGIKLDCFHLDYFTNKFHFAGHYTAMYGYDAKNVFLVDTQQQGSSVTTSLKNFELARNEKGPMSSKNKSYTITKNSELTDLKTAVKNAIYNNALDYTNPPIKNIGYKGILKTSTEIVTWFNYSENVMSDFTTTAMLMERAGTGGALFRNLYRDFLKESAELLDCKEIEKASIQFIEIADLWKQVSDLFLQIKTKKDIKYIEQAAKILVDISNKEKQTFEQLIQVTK